MSTEHRKAARLPLQVGDALELDLTWQEPIPPDGVNAALALMASCTATAS